MAEKEKLFQAFPPISTEAWEEKIHKDLKGADYDRKLVWNTIEGFKVKPYYRAEHLNSLEYLLGLPGEFPYQRGNKTTNDWLIRQNIKVEDVLVANKKARNVLKLGVNSLGFIINRKISTVEFEQLLEKINPETVSINFISGNGNISLLNLYTSYINKEGYDKKKVFGSDDFDPYGHILKHGASPCKQGDCTCVESNFLIEKNKLPNFRFLSVNARNVHNSGGSIVQELGIGLSIGAEYLHKLTDQGHEIDEITNKMQFVFAVGSNYFMEIAKLRAARLLWTRVVNAYNPKSIDACKIFIHTETSSWNKTIYDSHVNMLRSTTEAMSAALGSTDSMTVLPFDTSFNEGDDFSERIARNVQIILKEEAHFDKVADPSAGSYYIENLTNNIIEKAWELFIDIQDKGGFLDAFKKGFIQDMVEETARKRDLNIAIRKEILLGTNQYPNFNEKIGDKVNEDKVFTSSDKSWTIGRPLIQYRGAEAFEKMRLATDNAKKTPKVFMLKLGNVAMRQARAQFASNFFACAGFEIEDNLGYNNVIDGLADANKFDADIIVLCSSDKEYELFATEIQNKIDDKTILVIAGNPACRKKLESEGINKYIHVKSNVLEELMAYQNELGI